MRTDAKYEGFVEDLYNAEKDKECRYAVYDAEYEGGAGMQKNKILFFMWSVCDSVKCFMLTRTTMLNYCKTTEKHTVYRRFGFTSEAFIRTKGGNMDQEDGEYESRRGELPTEPRMGQAFTY